MQKSTNPLEKLKEALRQQALESGFDAAGFAPPHPPPNGDHFQKWLDQGCHGEMQWMRRHPSKRQNPASLLEGLGVIMVLGVNYRPPNHPDLQKSSIPIAAYACHEDYHALLKKKVAKLGRWLEEEVGHPIAHRVFVDTAPVLEKPLAMAAGIGWQGKNALLVSRDFGCWMLLAELFLALPLPPDLPESDHCGRCDRCLVACPTDALNRPYQMDASRCLAFFTVESHGAIPHQYREALGQRIFGCDACITPCPWNRFAPVTQEATFLPRIELIAKELTEWAELNAAEFKRLFHDTPIYRLGVNRFLRNVAIALGNWGQAEALPPLQRLLNHDAPLVREHALWSLNRIAAAGIKNHATEAMAMLRTRMTIENDPTVIQPLHQAILASQQDDSRPD